MQLKAEDARNRHILYNSKNQSRMITSILNQEIEHLEKELAQHSAEFRARLGEKPTSILGQDIKEKLQPDEAAIEIIRTPFYSLQGPVNPIKDSIRYIALIVSHHYQYPEMVIIDNGKTLEKQYIKMYQNAIKFLIQDTLSYLAFWGPIEKKLKGIKKIYLCPDGIYHKINLQTLFNKEKGNYLGDDVEIQLLGNTRDILTLSSAGMTKNYEESKMYFFGYPDFTNANAPGTLKYTEIQSEFKHQRFLDQTSGHITILEGTRSELLNIQQIIEHFNIPYKLFVEHEANEVNLKKVDSPYVLHIATHVFFIEDESAVHNNVHPLLKSGLLLAGAELAVKGIKQEGEDGIFTALEAMNLNLHGTELVVLSACETGLGDIINGEGVFGLQRAFMEAGARSVVMSLWKVDDQATQKMMTLFYQHLVVHRLPKRLAFNKAQQELRQMFPEPYYWGAFIMVGE